MKDQITNLFAIATILLSTNIVEHVSPSGESKVRVETAVATIAVPGWMTNTMGLSTNTTRYVWCEVRPRPERNPLGISDFPPLPPALPKPVTNTIK